MASKKALDEATGKATFEKVKPTLLALAPDAIAQINVDLQTAAMAALVLVDRANQGDRKARFALLPSALFPKGTVSDLEDLANAALHIEVESAREKAATTGAKVDIGVVQQGSEVRERMIKTLAYNLGDRDSVAREIADIRLGTGYLDLANDLQRLAALYVSFKGELVVDKRNYDPADATQATTLATRIRADYRAAATRSDEYSELRAPAYSEMARLYNEVRDAAQFLFRAEPAVLDEFPPLRVATAVLSPKRAKKPSEATPTEPMPPAPPPATPPAPTAGTNGGSPSTGGA